MGQNDGMEPNGDATREAGPTVANNILIMTSKAERASARSQLEEAPALVEASDGSSDGAILKVPAVSPIASKGLDDKDERLKVSIRSEVVGFAAKATSTRSLNNKSSSTRSLKDAPDDEPFKQRRLGGKPQRYKAMPCPMASRRLSPTRPPSRRSLLKKAASTSVIQLDDNTMDHGSNTTPRAECASLPRPYASRLSPPPRFLMKKAASTRSLAPDDLSPRRSQPTNLFVRSEVLQYAARASSSQSRIRESSARSLAVKSSSTRSLKEEAMDDNPTKQPGEPQRYKALPIPMASRRLSPTRPPSRRSLLKKAASTSAIHVDDNMDHHQPLLKHTTTRRPAERAALPRPYAARLSPPPRSLMKKAASTKSLMSAPNNLSPHRPASSPPTNLFVRSEVLQYAARASSSRSLIMRESSARSLAVDSAEKPSRQPLPTSAPGCYSVTWNTPATGQSSDKVVDNKAAICGDIIRVSSSRSLMSGSGKTTARTPQNVSDAPGAYAMVPEAEPSSSPNPITKSCVRTPQNNISDAPGAYSMVPDVEQSSPPAASATCEAFSPDNKAAIRSEVMGYAANAVSRNPKRSKKKSSNGLLPATGPRQYTTARSLSPAPEGSQVRNENIKQAFLTATYHRESKKSLVEPPEKSAGQEKDITFADLPDEDNASDSNLVNGNCSDSKLVEAKAVGESTFFDDQQVVEQVDLEQQKRVSHKRRSKAMRSTWGLLTCLALSSIFAIVIVVVILTTSPTKAAQSATVATVTTDETVTTTPSPTSPLVWSLLPNDTQKAITEESTTTSQKLAYDWMMEDPDLEKYDDWRLLQRFALATFYFATTNGNSTPWFQHSGWLSYEDHECTWYANPVSELRAYWNISFEGPCISRSGNNTDGEDGVYKHIQFERSGLHGSIPPEVFLLTSLETLILGGNDLNSTIPTQIGQVTNLESVYFSGCHLSGTLPTEIGLLHESLWTFEAYFNGLTGTIPSQLGTLTNLVWFMAESNKLHGSIPSEIGNLQSLQVVFLDDQTLSGTIPTEVGLLSSLEDIWFDGNRLTGELPSQLGLLQNIWRFTADQNLLSGVIPSEIGGMVPLVRLELGDNLLTGTIPSQLANLVAMPEIPRFHHFYDPPIQFGRMEKILLGQNLLNGTLPAEIFLLTDLTTLDIHGNSLSGPLPVEIGQLTRLVEFRADDNAFTGLLPNDLQLLNYSAMELFNISTNQLSGTMPEAGCSLGLQQLSFDCLPPTMCGCECTCSGKDQDDKDNEKDIENKEKKNPEERNVS